MRFYASRLNLCSLRNSLNFLTKLSSRTSRTNLHTNSQNSKVESTFSKEKCHVHAKLVTSVGFYWYSIRLIFTWLVNYSNSRASRRSLNFLTRHAYKRHDISLIYLFIYLFICLFTYQPRQPQKEGSRGIFYVLFLLISIFLLDWGKGI